jgi:hypothetical protein
MKQFDSIKKCLKQTPAFILFFLFIALNGTYAQKKVFVVTKGDQISSTGATIDSSLIDSLRTRFQVRVWKYSANLVATDSLSLDSAGVIVITRNVSSGQLINTATTAAWWSRRPVPIIYLPVQLVSNNRCKHINAGSTVVRSYSNNGYIRPKDLVIKAFVNDPTDPAFKGVTITNNKVDYFKWIYETINMDSLTFVTSANGNYGKLLLTAYDPDTTSTNKKVLMIRWNPGDSTYRNSGIKVANYRTYMEIGTDVNAAFRYFNNFQAQSIQILANEIKFLCPDISTGIQKRSIAKENIVNTFPNPFKYDLTVDIDKISPEAVISVYKLNGTKVLSMKVKDKQTKLNTSGLAPGVYLLKIVNKNETFVKQIVKQ